MTVSRSVEQNWRHRNEPNIYGHLIFNKGVKIIQWEKYSIFNKWCLFNLWLACSRKQINPFLPACLKPKSKWIKALHIKPDTLKLREENLWKSLENMGIGKIFLNRKPIAYALRSRINKWDIIKVQIFCKANDPVNMTKWQPTHGEKIITNLTSDRGLIPNIY